MKIVLFDIDNTLLNTSAMAQNLAVMTSQKSGLSLEEVESSLNTYTTSLENIARFDFAELIEVLPVRDEVKDKIKEQYFNNSEIYTKYPDVDEVFSKLHERGYRIGIFSEGSPQFQENKLKNLHLDSFLDSDLIFIAESKRSNGYISSLPPLSVIVDDSFDVCNLLSQSNNHEVIHLNTKGVVSDLGRDDSTLPQFVAIDSLSRLIDILD